MLKTAGLLLILGFCAWTGVYMSARVRKRVQESERFIRLLTVIRTQIEFALLPTDALLCTLCESREFSDFAFIHKVQKAFDGGVPLEIAWNRALTEYASTSALHAEEIELISAFGSTFGNTDKSGQTANCTYFIEQLEQLTEKQRNTAEKNARLYNALGVLTGLFLVILLL